MHIMTPKDENRGYSGRISSTVLVGLLSCSVCYHISAFVISSDFLLITTIFIIIVKVYCLASFLGLICIVKL